MGRPLKATNLRSRIVQAKPQPGVAAISTKARRAKKAIAMPKRAAATKATPIKKTATRVMTQPTKGDLRRQIEQMAATVAKLRAEAKDFSTKLKEAKREARNYKEAAESAEQSARSNCDEYNQKIKRLQENIVTERNGRLKAQARVNELEAPALRAQGSLDRETAERVQRLKAAVEDYKGKNTTLDKEVGRLNAEVKQLRGSDGGGFT